MPTTSPAPKPTVKKTAPVRAPKPVVIRRPGPRPPVAWTFRDWAAL